MRKCSICGKTGHDARNCPEKKASEKRDHVFWVRVDNITPTEARKLDSAVKKEKARIAPEGRGTSALGRASDLPGLIQKSLKLLGSKEKDDE